MFSIDVVAPASKDLRGKQKHKKWSHQEHWSGSGEHSGHQEDTSWEKRLKQPIIGFQPDVATSLGNISAPNESRLLQPFLLAGPPYPDGNCFEARGSSKADALKDQFLKVEDSLNSALQANMKLVEDNKNLKDQETKEVNAEKEQIQQKAFDNVYNTHKADFDHCHRQMLHMCDVSEPGVFDIKKDAYEGGLVLIDEIMKEDVAPSHPRIMTLAKEPQVKGAEDRADKA
ncbi:hypothetical protein GYH30_035528 [Glycine max]|nr:hypothetical protein GYH30_035528 [Glycine max]